MGGAVAAAAAVTVWIGRIGRCGRGSVVAV